MAYRSAMLTTDDDNPYILAQRLGAELLRRAWTVTSAESCTGGGIAHGITAVAGSSQWFNAGFVTYSNTAKIQLLGIEATLLAEHGAVSEAVVCAMARGAAIAAGADVAVAVSGIAGPDGGSVDKPVGLVWLAWFGPKGTVARRYQFEGDREQVRQRAIIVALAGLVAHVAGRDTV